MRAIFKNENLEEYILGNTSLGFLDELSVFDKYQEDHDEYSDIILKITENDKLMALANDIKDAIENSKIRVDLYNKICGLIEFLKKSNKIILTID